MKTKQFWHSMRVFTSTFTLLLSATKMLDIQDRMLIACSVGVDTQLSQLGTHGGLSTVSHAPSTQKLVVNALGALPRWLVTLSLFGKVQHARWTVQSCWLPESHTASTFFMHFQSPYAVNTSYRQGHPRRSWSVPGTESAKDTLVHVTQELPIRHSQTIMQKKHMSFHLPLTDQRCHIKSS